MLPSPALDLRSNVGVSLGAEWLYVGYASMPELAMASGRGVRCEHTPQNDPTKGRAACGG
eukprot:COSAG01_NODE_30725_length_610_cov_1.947162_1_plen_59_part_10